MRTVSFTVLGGVGGEFSEQGTVADLLAAVPYLLSSRLIPPLHVVNDLLGTGLQDAGMSGGCTWEPFQIDEPEWIELKEKLSGPRSGETCEYVEPPPWVRTFDDWNSWVMMYRHGFPEEFRELNRACQDLERARARAMKEGNMDLAEVLHLKAVEAGNKLAELVMNHVDRNRSDE